MSNATELLRRVYKMLVVFSQDGMLGHDESKALTDIEAYFLTPCDDPETDFGMMDDAEEPVAWMFETARGRHYAKTKKDSVQQARLYGNYVSKPLYLHPPPNAETEAKPVGWWWISDWGKEELEDRRFPTLERCVDAYEGMSGRPIALYAHPPRPEPARKPMTEEEIAKGFYGRPWPENTAEAFTSGIRFAEKHHGITE